MVETYQASVEIIKRLIGDDEFELLFSANASLNGYSIKESSVMINGKNINMEELNTIIVNLQNGTSMIESIIIE